MVLLRRRFARVTHHELAHRLASTSATPQTVIQEQSEIRSKLI